MTINVGDDIGLEMHPDVNQFIRIEQDQGLVIIGDDKYNLYYRQRVYEDYVILILKTNPFPFHPLKPA
jgi:hypothetical protein